jgi:hypothetical protein
MVAKITYGASIYGAVSYNHNKVNEGTASIIHTHNMISNSNNEPLNLSQILRSFEDYLSANKRTKTPVAHFSLNPAIEDKLTDDKLKILAAEYMEGMGYKDQPYIVYKHNDINREHIHIVSIRIDETGKKLTDSFDYNISMDLCRELETKYGLKQISNEQQEDTKLFLKKVDYEKGDIKRQISNILKTVTKDYKFRSFGELNALLSCFNIHSKIVKGEEDNNLYRGVVYTATNDSGDPVSKPIKSSLISKSFGYDQLEKLMNKESKKINPKEMASSGIKNIVQKAMYKKEGKENFIQELKKLSIDVVFRQNDSGRIYGVTFVDHNNKMVLNGSKLGKEFSANAFNQLFIETADKSQQKQKSSDSIKERPYVPDINANSDAQNTISGSQLDDLFGVFYTPPSANQDEVPLKKKKKKQRRKKNL